MSVIAAPAAVEARYRHGRFDVHRFAVSPRSGLAEAQGEPDRIAAANFARIVDLVRPDIVHLHAHTSAVSELLLDDARRAGAGTVVTYHTPTFSCMRGTLLHMGRAVCDGVLQRRRCAACALAGHRVPPAIAATVALVPPSLGRAVARHAPAGRWRTAVAMSAAVEAGAERFGRLMDKASRVVAPADWVTGVLSRNGVQTAKMALVRQGLPGAHTPGAASARSTGGPLRIGFFGRSSPVKGIDTLTRMLPLIADADVALELTVVHEADGGVAAEALRRAAAADRRITIRGSLPPEGVVAAMRSLDLVAVPSRWLETGPLVVLEAFAAGTPVLGSNLGGIAELVTDGVDGILLPADDVAAWAETVAALAADRARLDALRGGVRPPRTMADVAREMAMIYREVAP
jgi:glycosyltransferase involved in cell wall biosynthesis